MTITRDFREGGRREAYRILSSLVIPRPIAWVSTLGEGGIVNLAPFSSFMGIFNPPALAITFGRKSDGSLKDSHRNLRGRAEAVVHIADGRLLPALHASAEEVPAAVSEMERLGLAAVPSRLVAPPRVAEAPVALECRLREEHPLGESSDLVILDVLMAHVADVLWNREIDCADGGLWQPLSRLGSLGGPNYALPGERFTLGRPKLPG